MLLWENVFLSDHPVERLECPYHIVGESIDLPDLFVCLFVFFRRLSYNIFLSVLMPGSYYDILLKKIG